MHEYSLAKELVKTLLDGVPEDQLGKTEIVHVELGELRILSKEALSTAYGIITEDTLLEGSEIEYEDVKLEARCQRCDFSGPVSYEEEEGVHFAVPVLSCPECGGAVDILKGNELAVRKLTVADDDEG